MPRRSQARQGSTREQAIQASPRSQMSQGSAGGQASQGIHGSRDRSKPIKRWACLVHSRYVMGDFCYGDPFSNKNTVHEHKDEALDLEGASQCSKRAAEASLRDFLQARGINAAEWKKTIPNPDQEKRTPPASREFELAAVCEALPHSLTLAELFADFLTSGAKVVRAGPSKDLTSVLLAQGSRVFFEVSAGLRNDFFVTTKNSARANKDEHNGQKQKHKGPKQKSTLVYIFNGEDPSKDWEDVFRSSSADCANVFDQIVFVWCAYAQDLATQDRFLKQQARADEAEKLIAELRAQADNLEKELARLKALSLEEPGTEFDTLQLKNT